MGEFFLILTLKYANFGTNGVLVPTVKITGNVALKGSRWKQSLLLYLPQSRLSQSLSLSQRELKFTGKQLCLLTVTYNINLLK